MEKEQHIDLKPSDIRFSQDSIANKFSDSSTQIANKNIGKVLDELCEGKYTLNDSILNNMQIGKAPDHQYENLWFTVNNRSLWVLKELQTIERLNQTVHVKVDPNGIATKRFTTKNEGECIRVREPVEGKNAVRASFWEGKLKPAGVYTAAGGGRAMFDEEDVDGDGYDSDEYYI